MRVLTAVLACMLMIPSLAAGQEKEETSRWADEAELGFVDTGGNSETTTLSLRNELSYLFSDPLKGLWTVTALKVETEGVTTAERYFTEFRLDYQVNPRLYSFAKLNWLQDEPAGIDTRYTLGAGVGYHFLTDEKHELRGEAGLDYTDEEYVDNTADDYLALRLFGMYGYNFNDKNRFTQSLEYLPDLGDFDNYLFNSVTAFTSAISDVFSLKTSYEVNYNNEPPTGFEKTDTRFGITLVASFP